MILSPLEPWIARKIGVSHPFGRELLEQYQLNKINKTLALAQNHSFYQKKKISHSIASLKEMERLPFTYSKDVAEGKQLLGVSLGEISRVITLHTSGTAGTPKRVYFTEDDQEVIMDFFGNGMETIVNSGESMMILLPCSTPGGTGDLLMKGISRIPVRVIPQGLVTSLPQVLNRIIDEKADTLIGMPVQVLALARYSAFLGVEVPIKRVLLSYDWVPAVLKQSIENIWNCEVFDHYGMTEMGLGGGVDCQAHQGYHMREADLYVEIIDPQTGKALPDGEQGEIVFTTLTRTGMPLIRYRTGDISRFLPLPCSCGSILKRIEFINKRMIGGVQTDGGVLEMSMLDEALFRLPQIIDFSVYFNQTNNKQTLKLKIVTIESENPLKKELIHDVLHSIQVIEKAGSALMINVEILPPTDSLVQSQGKRRIQLERR